MPVTLEQAKAITQAITFDVWNNSSKPERIALMGTYCSPQVEAYAPDGSKTVGIEDVRRPNSANYSLLSALRRQSSTNACDSVMELTINSTPTGVLLGSLNLVVISG